MSGFPQPFLVGIEPYLNDDDASSLAQCCKSHMLICYMRASRLFRWNEKAFVFDCYYSNIFLYPATQFMRMQCAKICLVNYRPDVAEEEEKSPLVSLQVVMSLTFDAYMKTVCLKDASELLSVNPHRLPNKYSEVYDICRYQSEAKCSMAARLRRIDLYLVLRSRVLLKERSFLLDALAGCTFSDCNFIDIVLNELKLSTSDMRDYCFDYFGDHWQDDEFNFFEHPILGYVITQMYDVDVGKWFYILLCSRKNVKAAQDLQKNLLLSDREVLEKITNLSYSFISDDYETVTEYVKGQGEFFEHYQDEQEVLNLAVFEPTRDATGKRLVQWIPYFKQQGKLDKLAVVSKLARKCRFLY